jgi:hypothetical protein
MIRFSLAFILTLTLTPIAWGQILIGEKFAAHEPIVASVSPPGDGLGQHVLWQVSEPAKIQEFGNTLAIWAAPGKYRISAAVMITKRVKIGEEEVDVLQPGSFIVYRADFEIVGDNPKPIPPGPGPTPGPNPPVPDDCNDVPADQFANLGKRVCGWVGAIPAQSRAIRTQLGAVYRNAATKLESAEFLNIRQAGEYIATERAKIVTSAFANDWSDFGTKITAELASRPNMDRASMVAFYRAIGAGLK